MIELRSRHFDHKNGRYTYQSDDGRKWYVQRQVRSGRKVVWQALDEGNVLIGEVDEKAIGAVLLIKSKLGYLN